MKTQPPSRAIQILTEVGIELALKEGDPTELLGALRAALKHDPSNTELKSLADRLAAELADSPAIILIERTRIAGRALTNPDGKVYIEEPDGRLRPANGHDLTVANERFPGFLKNWRLEEDQG